MNLTRERNWPTRGHERGSLLPAGNRRAGRRQVLQDVPLLLAQRGDRRQDALDELTTCLTLGAKATPSPQHRAPQRPLRTIIRRLYVGFPDKSPQRRFQLHEVATRA